MRLRSVELQLPQAESAKQFLTEVWGLSEAGRNASAAFLRGTGDHPYVIALSEAGAPSIGSISFAASPEELERLLARLKAAGVRHEPMAQFDEPGAPRGFMLAGNEGQLFRFVSDGQRTAALASDRDRPIQLTHAVLNARDRAACTRFAVDVLGFKLSDRTRGMSFVRCDETHHAIAFADADLTSLNHLAFEMVNLDAVMRGIGRMKDHGCPVVWGPGRHGPGNNVFGYFVAPFGAVIEYTSEIVRVDDSYRTGGPDDWRWPPNRGDQWGITVKDTARMEPAERRFRFRELSGARAVA